MVKNKFKLFPTFTYFFGYLQSAKILRGFSERVGLAPEKVRKPIDLNQTSQIIVYLSDKTNEIIAFT